MSIPEEVLMKFKNQKLELERQLQQFQLDEKDVAHEMNNFLKQKSHLDSKVKGLSKMLPTLKVIKQEAETLVDTINDISDSSEKISGKIRSLDKARVSNSYSLLNMLNLN